MLLVDIDSPILITYRSPNTPEDASAGANQVISEFSSTVTEVLSEKNMNVPGKKKASLITKYVLKRKNLILKLFATELTIFYPLFANRS